MSMSAWAPAGKFSAHNVVLPDGKMTLPGEPILAHTVICQVALNQLREHVAPGGKVIDLGCLDGGYAAAFAREGYESVGVDARAVNVEVARWLQAQLGLPNLHFALADVRDYLSNARTLGWSYDAVFCCGLLYHLDQPAAFLKLVAQVTTKVLILNTHYSVAPVERNEGYAGHWYGDNLGDRWSSFGNDRSFWPSEPELGRMITDAGFHGLRRLDGGNRHDRGMWVAFR